MQPTGDQQGNNRLRIAHAIAELIIGAAAISLGIVLIPTTYDIALDTFYNLGNRECTDIYLNHLKRVARNGTGILAGVSTLILGLLGLALIKNDGKQMQVTNIVSGIVAGVMNLHGAVSIVMPNGGDFICIQTVFAMHIAIVGLCVVTVPIAISHTVRCANQVCLGASLPTQRSNQISAVVIEDLEKDPGKPIY